MRPTPADEVIDGMLASGRFVATENGTVMHRDIRYKDKRWKPCGWRHKHTNRWILFFEKKKVLRSRFVARWFHGPIPPDHIVHHKDGNPIHDDPMNLAVMPDHDHATAIWSELFAKGHPGINRTPEAVAKWRATMEANNRFGSRSWSEEKKRRLLHEGSPWLERLRKQAPIAARKRYPNCPS